MATHQEILDIKEFQNQAFKLQKDVESINSRRKLLTKQLREVQQKLYNFRKTLKK